MDMPELDDDFWAGLTLVEAPPKELISIRLDSEMLDWFRQQGRGYQARINAVLCLYVKSQNQKNQSNVSE